MRNILYFDRESFAVKLINLFIEDLFTLELLKITFHSMLFNFPDEIVIFEVGTKRSENNFVKCFSLST